jgi:hypothetical protein
MSIYKFFSFAFIMSILSSGCATIPMSNIRDHERIEVTFRKPVEAPKTTQRGWVDVAMNVARVAAYAASVEAESVYGGSYGGKVSGNFVTSSDRSLAGLLRLDRLIGTTLVCRVDADIVPVIVDGSKKGYFRIVPKRVALSCTKAKLTNSFGADVETLSIRIVSRFPSASQKDGSVDYVYGFSLLDVKPGTDLRFNGQPSSDVFEVASDGPVTFSVDVVERTSIVGFWQFVSGVLGNKQNPR